MIRLSKSVLDQQEVDRVSDVLLNCGYLGMGTYVGDFELKLENYLGNNEYKAVCVNSGTAALHLALASVTEPGNEVLVPSYTFVSTYQAIIAAGCKPISCEINYETLLLDLDDCEKRITPQTTVILPVFFGSNISNYDEVYLFAKKHSLRVVEDAAHCFGCIHNGRKIGAQGDIVCFSFDGIKNITSGEGGAIISSNKEVLRYVRDARLLGVCNDLEKRYVGKRSWDFDVINPGLRYHMSNIFAAIGMSQLEKLEPFFAPRRQEVYDSYVDKLSNVSGIKLIHFNLNDRIVHHIFPILVTNGKRNKLRAYLEANGVQTGVQYKPNHLLSLFHEDYDLPITIKVYAEELSLPMHPEVTEEDVVFITKLIKDFLSK